MENKNEYTNPGDYKVFNQLVKNSIISRKRTIYQKNAQRKKVTYILSQKSYITNLIMC